MTDIVELILSRIGSEFDGECHLSEDEARQVADEIKASHVALMLANGEIERLNDALSEAEKERDAARIWHSKAKAFLEELGDTRIRAEKAEAELAKANDDARITNDLLTAAVDDYNGALAELAQARKALEEADEAVLNIWADDSSIYGVREALATIRAALITDTVRTEGEQT